MRASDDPMSSMIRVLVAGEQGVFMRRVLFAICLFFGMPSLAYAQPECQLSNVLLIVDRSISMKGMVGGEEKWTLTRNAVETMLTNHSQAARFGLMIYPGPSGAGAQGIVGPVDACAENMMQGCVRRSSLIAQPARSSWNLPRYPASNP